MSKYIQIIDTETGEVEVDIATRSGYSLQYCTDGDFGDIKIFGRVMNGGYGQKHWIKNFAYHDTVVKLLHMHKKHLHRFDPNRILFLEDMGYEPKKDSGKIDWAFRIKVASKDLYEIWGYEYVIESRLYWVEKLSDANIAARIYCCLKRIDGQGGLKDFEIMDFEETYSEFGRGWQDNPNREVADILSGDFEWGCVRKAKRQVSLMDYEEDLKEQEEQEMQRRWHSACMGF